MVNTPHCSGCDKKSSMWERICQYEESEQNPARKKKRRKNRYCLCAACYRAKVPKEEKGKYKDLFKKCFVDSCYKTGTYCYPKESGDSRRVCHFHSSRLPGSVSEESLVVGRNRETDFGIIQRVTASDMERFFEIFMTMWIWVFEMFVPTMLGEGVTRDQAIEYFRNTFDHLRKAVQDYVGNVVCLVGLEYGMIQAYRILLIVNEDMFKPENLCKDTTNTLAILGDSNLQDSMRADMAAGKTCFLVLSRATSIQLEQTKTRPRYMEKMCSVQKYVQLPNNNPSSFVYSARYETTWNPLEDPLKAEANRGTNLWEYRPSKSLSSSIWVKKILRKSKEQRMLSQRERERHWFIPEGSPLLAEGNETESNFASSLTGGVDPRPLKEILEDDGKEEEEEDDLSDVLWVMLANKKYIRPSTRFEHPQTYLFSAFVS